MQKKSTLRLFLALSLALFQANAYAQVSTLPAQEAYVDINSNGVNLPISLSKMGKGVRSIEYTLTQGGKVIATKTINIPAQSMTSSGQSAVNVLIPPYNDTTVDELSLNIIKVNGQPTNMKEPYTTIIRKTLSQYATRKVVVEDYTAMWCGWCPRGLAMLSYLTRQHPNDFIGIAIHGSSDPLMCRDYSDMTSRISGYPTITFDRSVDSKDYSGENTFNSERRQGADMDVSVSAVWDRQKRNISITTKTTFRTRPYRNTYALAYVLTADGLQSRSYYQKNYFSGNRQYSGYTNELNYFVNAPSTISNFKFDHTAISALGITSGINGSISQIVVDKPQTHTASFDNISQYRVIQDKSKLHVVVLVLNTSTGKIVNADQCEISDHTPSGIESAPTTDEVVEVARYNISGALLDKPVKGLNIVKYSDGRIVKEIVK
ncbi:Omp28-related outer membrane protein [Prevotella scopos JCM 17725]|uniref:Outer membrane protein Omp28 n=1 Tax=Prevotella scopos JCM 17725 TaxID=1236518 RepID=A0AAX2F104_9BACT|nr:Omp28-related outer membrane protein [Prevotella scopos]ANR73436.1 hypothetical protein AXF22_07900 [Prevotella scopos JCM 17725]QUB44021.1 Omp28-related outer membrane protein [Prevotella scopos JCM 17725]SHF55227.1 Outer membrane protein Omp28 [Prevotella scopos JCM 17725]